MSESKKDRNRRKARERDQLGHSKGRGKGHKKGKGKGHEKHHEDPAPVVSPEPVLTIVPDDVVEEEEEEKAEPAWKRFEDKPQWDKFDGNLPPGLAKPKDEDEDDELPS